MLEDREKWQEWIFLLIKKKNVKTGGRRAWERDFQVLPAVVTGQAEVHMSFGKEPYSACSNRPGRFNKNTSAFVPALGKTVM